MSMDDTNPFADPRGGPTYGSRDQDRLDTTRNQVDEVVGIMRDNVNKVMERENKLSELNDRADTLRSASASFATSGRKLRKKYWWENMKMKLILGVIGIVILAIIIGVIWSQVGGSGGSDDSGSNTPASKTTTAS